MAGITPTQRTADLQNTFFYEQKTGHLLWKRTCNSRALKGTVAGSVGAHGYRAVCYKYKWYTAHRIIWFLHYGYFPENDIDHINRNRDDNRIENLREVSRSCNLRNSPNRKDNTSGVKGVVWRKDTQKWMVRIRNKGINQHLGCYTSFIDAICARLAGEQALNWYKCDSLSPAHQYLKQKGVL